MGWRSNIGRPGVLIIDDDADFRRLLKRYLAAEKFRVEAAADVHEGLSLEDVDIMLLDIRLEHRNGLDLAFELRKERPHMGIIMMTGNPNEVDRIVGLETGADDYISKPVNEREVAARIRSLYRRLCNPVPHREVVRFGDFILDLNAHRLKHARSGSIDLSEHEFHLLELFVTRPNQVLTREAISQYVFNREWIPTDRSIDVLLTKLRKKLGVDGGKHMIGSVRGVGYRFEMDTEEVD